MWSTGSGPAVRASLLALAVFVTLAVVHTWPLARNPAHLSRVDNGDMVLNAWTIAWVAHELPRDPRHLFDANIFYPQRRTLAYSEAMIVQGVLAAPILMAGGSPVLAFNLVSLAGFALTGWAFCLLVRHWTQSWSAAYVGGSLAAFNSHVLTRLPHLQTHHVEFVAVMLLAFDRLTVSRRVRDAVWLGVAFALQSLASVYLMTFSVWMLLFAALGRAREWMRTRPRQWLALMALAGIVALALLAPYLIEYYRFHSRTGVGRTVDDARRYAGTWASYLATGSRLHFGLWAERFFFMTPSANFPGITALVLAILALAIRTSRADARVQMCAVAAAGCLTVAILPNASFYPWLHRSVILFQMVRVPAHLGLFVLLMVAVLAAYGVRELERWWPHPKRWPWVAVALFLLVNVEALRAPIDYTPFSSIPAVYEALAHEPKGSVVVEVPLYPPRILFANAMYMLDSTVHWQALVNGYSGIRPDWYDDVADVLEGFPDERSYESLRAQRVTHIVVHADAVDPSRLAEVARTPWLQLMAREGPISIYRLR